MSLFQRTFNNSLQSAGINPQYSSSSGDYGFLEKTTYALETVFKTLGLNTPESRALFSMFVMGGAMKLLKINFINHEDKKTSLNYLPAGIVLGSGILVYLYI